MPLKRLLWQTQTPPNPLTPPSTQWVTLSPREEKPPILGLNRHRLIKPFGFRSKHWKNCRQPHMDYGIDFGVSNGTLWVCKPNSPCNDSHWAVPQNNDWAVKWGKPKGDQPKGGSGVKGGGGGKGGRRDKGGKGALYRPGRWLECTEAPLQKEVALRHPCDTKVDLIFSRLLKRQILTSEVEGELSVQVVLPNGEVKALCGRFDELQCF